MSATLKTKDPLEGKTLQAILTELVEVYGWAQMGLEIKINCFLNQPTMASSLKFLRRTPWACAQVEDMYRAHAQEKDQDKDGEA